MKYLPAVTHDLISNTIEAVFMKEVTNENDVKEKVRVKVRNYSSEQLDEFLDEAGDIGIPYAALVAAKAEDPEAMMLDLTNGIAPTADQAKTYMWEKIKLERDRRTRDGGFNVGDDWYHSDDRSRTQQLGLIILGDSLPSNLLWKTMGGEFVPMTQTLAKQILGPGAVQDRLNFIAAETHKGMMEASASPMEYDYSGGWPLMFGEDEVAPEVGEWPCKR